MTGRRLAVAAAAVAGAGGCGGEPSILDPAGDRAAEIVDLWWLMLAVGAAVWVLVVVVLGRSMLQGARRRSGESGTNGLGAPDDDLDGRDGRRLVVAGGIVLPVVVLAPLLVVVLRMAGGMPHQEPAGAGGDGVRIEVVGHQFWWEVRYPDSGAVTANEVHVPVGRPVTLVLGSDDVIHSFWIPNVAGKIDLIPGETTHLSFTVRRAGTFRGVCAEYCGVQHALMRLLLVAQPPATFDRWAAATAADAAEPGSRLAAEGEEVFNRSGCAACHTVRGTAAAGELGPDLTHLARRRTLGAGAVPNTRGDLAGWVVDAQGIKPGNRMPPQPLDPEELQAVLAYLEGLR